METRLKYKYRYTKDRNEWFFIPYQLSALREEVLLP